jgi:adenylate kinase
MESENIKTWLGMGSINIFGLPFSGKDTQAHALAADLDAEVISGGDILRSHSDQTTIKKLMLTGELFPTDYYLGIITPFLSRQEYADMPLILSSVGRWHGEEEAIIKATTESGHPLKAVINLELDEAEVWRRFEASNKQKDRGFRHDDASQILEIRLNEFQTKTLPVIDFYRDKGLLIDVDGSKPAKIVTQEIVGRLALFAQTSPA